MGDEFPRHSLADMEVTGHQHYGLLIRTASGVPGFIDGADIADGPIAVEDWPAIGSMITCVVLGVTREGRLYATARPSAVRLVGSVDNVGAAFGAWAEIRDAGFPDASARDAFFASRDAVAILRWALAQYASSADRTRALDVLASAPPDVKSAVQQS